MLESKELDYQLMSNFIKVIKVKVNLQQKKSPSLRRTKMTKQ